ncbi:zinc finger protein 23-like [Engraulis encrasicolus]|uniref:zinc finger protein 23-like n=1 Tax=Engraulis encrasicolus TaxID=184585 RepID=UPI002FCFA962
MACEIVEISHHINVNHKQACSDLEKASLFITEALQREIQRNTTLCMLIQRLEKRAAENGRSLSEQVESNCQLQLQVDELQTQLEDKDNSLTQAKQSIAVLKNELGDLKQQLQIHHRTIEEVTEWQQDESLANIVKEEDGVQQQVVAVTVKEEYAIDAYPCQSDKTDTSMGQTHSSFAGIRTELVQEEDEKSDMTPVVSSDPDAVNFLRLSVRLVDCCVTQGHQRTTSENNKEGETPNNVGITGEASELPPSATPKFTAIPETEVDNGRPYKCPVCGEHFSSTSVMEKHQQDTHTIEKPPLEQDQHTRTGKTPHHHKRHGKRVTRRTNALAANKHTDTGQKRHHCGQCGKSFKLPGILARHQRVHTGERPHECAQCGKAFTVASNLSRHKLIHTGQKPYHCGQCGKSFTQEMHLTRHQLIHTGEKPFQCTDCGKYFRHSGNLTTHRLIHTGERRHQCGQCGMRFTEAGSLGRHMFVHTGEKPHRCTGCGRAFSHLWKLRRHLRKAPTHTGDKTTQPPL